MNSLRGLNVTSYYPLNAPVIPQTRERRLVNMERYDLLVNLGVAEPIRRSHVDQYKQSNQPGNERTKLFHASDPLRSMREINETNKILKASRQHHIGDFASIYGSTLGSGNESVSKLIASQRFGKPQKKN